MLYRQPLTVASHFAYLGCIFGPDGIDWPKHWTRLRGRAMTVLTLLLNTGCHGNGMGLEAGLVAYRSLIRPIMEYGLCLVPGHLKQDLKIPQAVHQKCLSSLYCLGPSTCGRAVGRLLDLLPKELRHTRLQARWAIRTALKDDSFAIFWARASAAHRPLRKSSCFRIFSRRKPNELLRRLHLLEQRTDKLTALKMLDWNARAYMPTRFIPQKDQRNSFLPWFCNFYLFDQGRNRLKFPFLDVNCRF